MSVRIEVRIDECVDRSTMNEMIQVGTDECKGSIMMSESAEGVEVRQM